MDIETNAQELSDHKVMRRGLLAGVLALGAGVVAKLATPDRAQAQGEALIVGNTAFGPAAIATSNTVIGTGAISMVGLGIGPGPYPPAIGVHAITDGDDNIGVAGISSLGNGIGILGRGEGYLDVDPATAAGARGVYGTSKNYGVHGRTTNGFGVLGETLGGIGTTGRATGGGTGVVGESTTGIAVRGVSANNATGVKGLSNTGGSKTADGDGSGIGVHGKSGSGIGVKGDSTMAPGIEGTSVASLGVRGTSTNFVGVVGISSNNHGLYGFSGSSNGVALVGDNGGGGLAGIFNGSVQVFGSFQVFGAKNAVIKMPDGTNASVYCQESPEPYFEDFGRAQLVGGVANVPIEREFATLVGGGDYMVFLTPEGPSGGLYVGRRGPQGFEVRDPANGNVSFTYRIVTRRKDIEGRRFARVSDEGAKSVAAARAALGTSWTPPPGGPGGTVTPPGPFVPPSNPQMPQPNAPRSPQDGPR